MNMGYLDSTEIMNGKHHAIYITEAIEEGGVDCSLRAWVVIIGSHSITNSNFLTSIANWRSTSKALRLKLIAFIGVNKYFPCWLWLGVTLLISCT